MIAHLEIERSPLQTRLSDLQRTPAVVNVVSLIPDNPRKPQSARLPNVVGVAGSALDLLYATQISDIEEKIRAINNKIENAHETIRKHQANYDLLIHNEQINARELRALNCVSP